MEGVRILEVAQFTYVPSAGAVLADWGADVVKIEHAEKGDAQRGLVKALGHDVVSKGSTFAPIMEGPNRGKRSLGLSLEKPEAKEVLHELVRRSDVFLTNFLPAARRKLGIDLDDIRAINPNIIFVVGSAFGHAGPEAEQGGYDGTAFWARAGTADSLTPDGAVAPTPPPAGAYGDNIGGMTIAGGIAAALFARATTGEPSVVDVSLLGIGAWAIQLNVNLALQHGQPLPKHSPRAGGQPNNPLTGNYETSDGRWINLCMLQPGRYWADFVTKTGRPELASDERFNTTEKLMANGLAAVDYVTEIIRARTKDEWLPVLDTLEGQWALVQSTFELGNDPQLHATGQITEVIDFEGNTQKLVANPVQFDRKPAVITRAPQFAEHTDEILTELGFTDEQSLNFKIAGAVT